MFQVGDYVMGKDRSYKRSVYRVHKIVNNDLFHLQFICLGSNVSDKLEVITDRNMVQYEVITMNEVHKELGYKHVINLKFFLWELGVTKSYPEQL